MAGKEQKPSTKIIDISNEFFLLNDIKINGAKSEILIINPKIPEEERFLTMGSENVIVRAVPKKQDVRFLGVWINAEFCKKNNVNRLTEIVNDFVAVTKGKKATITQFKYLYNNVIMPKLEDTHKITPLTEAQCHKIERKAIALIKNKTQLPTTANDNIIHNRNLVGIKKLWDNYKEYHITSLSQRLNSDGPLNIITEIRLRRAQITLNLHISVLLANETQLHHGKLKNNLAIAEVMAGRSMSINITANTFNEQSHISGSGITSREAI